MPSLQVVDSGTPSFGSRLLNSFQQGFESKQDDKILGGLRPDMSPLELVQSIGRLSKEKQASLEPYFQQIIKGGTSGGMAGGALPWEGGQLPWESPMQQLQAQVPGQPQDMQLAAQQQPPAQIQQQTSSPGEALRALELQKAQVKRYLSHPDYKETAKQEIKDLDEKIQKTSLQAKGQNTFDKLTDFLEKDAAGVGVSPGTFIGLNRKGVENRSAFNTLSSKLESAVRELVNPTGALSKERFNYILKQIPSGSDSQRDIAGKLRGLSEALAEEGYPLDASRLQQIVAKWDAGESSKPSLESFIGKRR